MIDDYRRYSCTHCMYVRQKNVPLCMHAFLYVYYPCVIAYTSVSEYKSVVATCVLYHMIYTRCEHEARSHTIVEVCLHESMCEQLTTLYILLLHSQDLNLVGNLVWLPHLEPCKYFLHVFEFSFGSSECKNCPSHSEIANHHLSQSGELKQSGQILVIICSTVN